MTCPPDATGGAAETGACVGAGGDVGTIAFGIAVATAIVVVVGIITRVEVAGMAVLVATIVAVFVGACVGDRFGFGVGDVVGACVAVAAAIAVGEFAITVGGMGVFDGAIVASMICVAVAASVGWVMMDTGVEVAALQPINKLNTTNGQCLFTCFIISMNLSSFYQTFDGKKHLFDYWRHFQKCDMPPVNFTSRQSQTDEGVGQFK